MDPPSSSSNESSLRYLSFLVEHKHESLHEISDLSSTNQVYKSLEDSLNSSIYFYKSQLEKSDLQNTQLCQALHSVEALLTNKIKELIEELNKKIQTECISAASIARLNALIEYEIKLRHDTEYLHQQSEVKLRDLESQISLQFAAFVMEKQKMLENFSQKTGVLTRSLAEKQEKINTLEQIIAEKEVKVEKCEIQETSTLIIPVVEESSMIKNSAELSKSNSECERLKLENKGLITSISELLDDIEAKSSIFYTQKNNYEQLVISYNELARDFDEYKRLMMSQNETIESSVAASRIKSNCLSEMKEKYAILSNELHKLILENHKLVTGENTGANTSGNIENLITENAELKIKIRKADEESKLKSDLVNKKDLDLQRFKGELEKLNKTISELTSKSDILKKAENSRVSISESCLVEKLKLEINENKTLMQKYKRLYESLNEELFKTNCRLAESIEMIQSFNLSISSLKQENDYLRLQGNKAVEIRPQAQEVPPQSFYLSECVEEYEKKLAELIQDKKEANEFISSSQKELINCKQVWIEEITKLRSENDILRTISNTGEADKLRDELGKSRRRIREIKYLLEINEKELKDEKINRVKAEKTLRKLRKALSKKEKFHMATAEAEALNKKIAEKQLQISSLMVELKMCKEVFAHKEAEYEKSLDFAKQAYIKEKESNDVSVQNIKKLLSKLAELKHYYEQKNIEYSSLGDYLNSKNAQNQKLSEAFDIQNVGNIEISHVCSMLHNKIQGIARLQDTEVVGLLKKIENFDRLCKELKETIEQLQSKSTKLEQQLSQKQNLNESPQILAKMIALLHKSSKT